MHYLIIFNPERKSGCYSEEAVELSPGAAAVTAPVPAAATPSSLPLAGHNTMPAPPPLAAVSARRCSDPHHPPREREREERQGGRGQREGTRESHNFFLCVNDKWVPHIFFYSTCHLNTTSTPRVREIRWIPPHGRHVIKTTSKTVRGIKLHRF